MGRGAESAADITQAAIDDKTVTHAVNGSSLYNSKAQEFTAYKDILLHAPLNAPLPATRAAPAVGALQGGALAAYVARARQRAERIKSHPNYTAAISKEYVVQEYFLMRNGDIYVVPAGSEKAPPDYKKHVLQRSKS